MIKYTDGTEARVGDSVRLTHDTDSGTVTAVLDSVELADSWNLDEIGLMIDCAATGLTFYPARFSDEDIRFVSRSVA
jgi:hypothetical protein